MSMSLDPQLVRALVALREDGGRLAFVYVTRGSFERDAGDPPTLLPFLPPKDTDPRGSVPGGSRELHDSSGAGGGLSAEDRRLLLALASAGIPSITVERGDDLIRSLSLWQTAPRREAAV